MNRRADEIHALKLRYARAMRGMSTVLGALETSLGTFAELIAIAVWLVAIAVWAGVATGAI